jgi:hypothetical protein
VYADGSKEITEESGRPGRGLDQHREWELAQYHDGV